MVVGVYVVELYIRQSHSLKEKRRLLNSIKARMRNKFNLSVAEVGEHDKWQRATIGMASISNDQRFVNEVLDKAFVLISAYPEVEIIDHHLEFI